MNRISSVLLAILVTLLLVGCIEYERQTMTFRHDPATDTLLIFQDYQSVFGADDPAQLSEQEMEQLDSVLRGERTFFFNNWITEYSRGRLLEMKATPAGELDSDPAYESAIRSLVDTAVANIKVENVGFYLNGQKRLCGAQRVTVRNVSKVVAALNKIFPFVARSEADNDDKTSEERKLLRAFAASGQVVLRLEGNRLEIRWPVTADQFQEVLNDPHAGRAFRMHGGEMKHEEGILILSMGKKDAPSTSVELPFSQNPYSENAVPAAEKYGIKESLDAKAAAEAFLSPAKARE